ncbi:UDP-N-acetylglucosamine--N-acetylmuramyl-(pentapeptide) pyrophosphoryl-undecaprenol N-acetylglucosamine transferase [Alphaproteobacteria bacterium]|nr:UDP-N-acetylglucosamine--N-acetylmuramyl-(pentapeptide) pyrophosphoryl-undecaprenol N-acetylglucosamine transferase [Alphaproteobacteria bacterium]
MKKFKTILVSAGGTAGHAIPAVELANEFTRRNFKIIYITDVRMYNLVKKYTKDNNSITVLCFKGRGLYRSNILKNIKSILLLIISVLQSILTILIYRPILSYGFGGGITVPPILICKFFKVPIILHEGNIVVGRANIFLSKYAKVLTTFFPKVEGDISKNIQVKFVGMPVRKSIENIYTTNYQIKKNESINILVTGGSLGAEVMATKIAKALSSFSKNLINKISIIQQVRKENMDYVKSLYENASVQHKLEVYIEDFPKSLNWCHLIICRSGAGTIAENLISGRPSIMVPLAISSDNHQMKNALYIKKIGAGWIISNKELNNIKILQKTLKNFIFNESELYEASKLAKENALINSTSNLANIGNNFIKESN